MTDISRNLEILDKNKEDKKMNNLCLMSDDELMEIYGGDLGSMWAAAVAMGALLCVAAKESFNAGRQFVRDLRD